MELSKKDQQLGKMREIVKEADNRLCELKENRKAQDYLEKKQRVLSVENNKLKYSMKRTETQLLEKENLVESQNRQIKEISNNYRRLEEVKAIEIEMLRNEIRQKDGAIDELREDLNAVEAARDRLTDEISFLREENEQLKRMCENNLATIKEISSQNLQSYIKRKKTDGSKTPSVLERICKFQIADTKEITRSAVNWKAQDNIKIGFLDLGNHEEVNESFDNTLRASLDSLKQIANHKKTRAKPETFETIRLNNNMEIIIEAFETSLSENRILSQKVEEAERVLQDFECKVKESQSQLQTVSALKDSLTRLFGPLSTFVEEFTTDYQFLEKELKNQAKDVIYHWKRLVDSIKSIIEEEELAKISCWSKYTGSVNSSSKVMNSVPSGPSLLEESFDQERLFKEAEQKCDSEAMAEAEVLANSKINLMKSTYQLDAIIEETQDNFESFDLNALKMDENFTFDISQGKDCQKEERSNDERDMIDEIMFSDVMLSDNKTAREMKSTYDSRGMESHTKSRIDRDKDESNGNISRLANLSKSLKGASNNPFQIVADLKAKAAKKDKIIKFLKDLVKRFLEETESLTSKCLEFDPESFTEGDIVDLEFRFGLPIDDPRLQALPTRICNNLDKFRYHQCKAYVNGAKRVLMKFLTDEILDSTNAKDKKVIYSGLKELEGFDSKKWLCFESYLSKIDELSSFMEHKAVESGGKLSSMKNSSFGSEKSFQSHCSETVIKEIFRLTTPCIQILHDDDLPPIDKVMAELKSRLKSIPQKDSRFKKQLSRNPITPTNTENHSETIKLEIEAFLKAIQSIHAALTCDFNPDLSKLVQGFKKAKQILKELQKFSSSYFKLEEGFSMGRASQNEAALQTPLDFCGLGESHPVASFVSLVVSKELALISIRCRILEEKFNFTLY